MTRSYRDSAAYQRSNRRDPNTGEPIFPLPFARRRSLANDGLMLPDRPAVGAGGSRG